MPRPRKLSAASVKMASATWNVALTTIVPMAFGMMWRKHDPPAAAAHHADSLHVLPRSEGERLTSDQSGGVEPSERGDDEDEDELARLEDDREGDEEEQAGDREDDVDDTHHDGVDDTAEEAGDGTPDHADREWRRRRPPDPLRATPDPPS